MLETEDAKAQADAGEVILISNDDSPHPNVIEQADLSALTSNKDIPYIESVRHGCQVLEALLGEPPRAIGCIYKLDDLHFSEMRSSVLSAGIVALAVQAGHHAVIAPISSHLPAAHWRSEFIFRAVRGIRLLRPEMSEQELLFVVTRAIHFYTQHVPESSAAYAANWRKIPYQDLSAAQAH